MVDAESMTPERARAFATKIAFDRLAARDRSSAELRQALEKKQVPAEVITEVMGKLAAQGFVNDERFAFEWVAARHRSKGLARTALSRELSQKGIAPELIQLALESLDADDEKQRAHALIQRKLPSVARFDTATQKRRLTSFLMRKGYPPHVCFDVVNQELKASESFDEELYFD